MQFLIRLSALPFVACADVRILPHHSNAVVKILVIRLKQIGDALISLPVCKSLKLARPDAQIDYLVYEHIAPLFQRHPAIDNVLTISPAERRNRWLYFKKMRAIRRARYDMVIDLITVPITVLMTRYSGARWQIGFDKGKWRSRLYKTSVPHPPAAGSLDAKLSILKGVPFNTPAVRSFDVVLEQHEIDSMQQRMTSAGIVADKPVLLISPVSRLALKNWPEDYFVAVVEHCLEHYDVHAVMVWGPGERTAVDALAAKVKHSERVWTTIETKTLRELAALARNCILFIGNDSGPRHVAEAVGTPTFTIFAPTIGKHAWLPHQGPKHQGVDMSDVFAIDERAWAQRVGEFHAKRDHYYRQITPKLVIAKLDPMLRTLVQSREPGNVKSRNSG